MTTIAKPTAQGPNSVDAVDAMTALVRPQRQLTEAEWEVVRGTTLLRMHAALMLGIVDPVPNPSPMPEAVGAWVREHVWTKPFHEIDRRYPWGFWRWSLCERGTCWNCLNDRCDLCVHRQKGGPDVDDNTEWVHNQRGDAVAEFIPRPAGEPCMWWCRCPCPKNGLPPEPAGPRSEPAARPAAKEPCPGPSIPHRQAALFDLEA